MNDRELRLRSMLRCGTTVNRALHRVFTVNEHIYKEGRQNPWTDEEIANTNARVRPKSKVRGKGEVRRRRKDYNLGRGFWKKFGKPDGTNSHPTSYAYDEKGRRLPEIHTNRGRDYDADESIENVEKPKVDVSEDVIKNALNKHVPDILEHAKNVAQQAAKETKRPNIIVEFPERKQRKKFKGDEVHEKFQDVLLRIKADVPILLVGPTGSGKTHLAGQIAEALGMKNRFRVTSLSEGVNESHLLGRMLPGKNGKWEYHASAFVEMYEKGGVILLDEIDAADPNMLIQVNAAIANKKMAVPQKQTKPIPIHKDCVIVAAANTYGTGASREYVGRNKLDAATVNRFLMGTVEIDYDRNLEKSIAEATCNGKHEDLLEWAWNVRDRINESGLRRIMSTRTIQDSAKLLTVGASMDDVRTAYFAGWSEDERRRVNQS